MKKYLIFLLISLIPLSAGAADRGIVPIAIKDKSGKQIALYKESHALVIGVSEYANGWPRLAGVAEDVRDRSSRRQESGVVLRFVTCR